MATSLDPLYARNPGTEKIADTAPATAQTATAQTGAASTATARDATTKNATSQGYTAQTGVLSQGAMADAELNRISAQDSPSMQLAKQKGLETAASRGLLNSSIAAGAAQAETVKAATPLALQNASLNATNEMTDKSATNRASEFGAGAANTADLQNAQLGTATEISNATESNKLAGQNAGLLTQASLQNASEANRASSTNAQLGTQTNQFNATQKQNTANLNAAAENEMRTNVLNQNAQFNRQFLQGEQSMDLATIQAKYTDLLAKNAAANSLYQSFFNNISQTMQGNFAPDRVAEIIKAQQQFLQHGLDLMGAIDAMDAPLGNDSTSVAKPAGMTYKYSAVDPANQPTWLPGVSGYQNPGA
jgi:hypothetical protein